MKSDATVHDRHSAFLRGSVSLLRLLELYGESHRAEVEELWAAPGTDFLVLFSDDTGRDCAILPVGPAHEYKTAEPVMSLRIEGLHAVCHTPAREHGRFASLTLAEPDWAAYKAEFPEAAKGLSEALLAAVPESEPVRVVMRHLAARLREVARHEEEINRRERYLHQAEERLNTRAEEHLVNLAEIEQREQDLAVARKNFERRAGDSRTPFERTQALSRDLATFTA